MDKGRVWSVIPVLLTCLSFGPIISSTKQTGTCCSDGLELNYTLPMFSECKMKLHPNGSMVQTFPKLVPYSSAVAACPRRKSKLGVPPGHRMCRFPDCDSNLCVNGWCEETMKSFRCHCPAGYRGRHCNKISSLTNETMPATTTPSFTLNSTLQDSSCTDNAVQTTTPESTTMLVTESTTSTHVTNTPPFTTRDVTTIAITDPITSNPTTTQKSFTTRDVTTIATTDPITSNPTTTQTSFTTRDVTTTASTDPITSNSTPTQTSVTIPDETLTYITDSTTSNPTTTQKSFTTRDVTTIATTDPITSNPTTTQTSATTPDETYYITDSTTSNPTTTQKSTTTQATTTMSMTESTTSHPTTTTQLTAKIFVTDEDTENEIFVADLLDDLDFTSIPSTKGPRYITYDSVEKKIYWTDKDTKRVYRADVDGENREEVTFESSDELQGIAIAEISRTLYIANKGTKKITSVSIAQVDSFPRVVMNFASGLSEELYSLEVDEEGGFLYWSMKYHVQRKLLDGSGSTETIYNNDVLSDITGLSIDISRDPRRIFFCDFGKERSFYMNVNQPYTTAKELTGYMNDADISGKKLRDISYFDGTLSWTKEDSPSGIAVMTNYDQISPSFDIKETSVIGKPFQLLIINVNP